MSYLHTSTACTNAGRKINFIFGVLALAVLIRNEVSAQTPVVIWARNNHGIGNTGNWADNFGTGIVSDASGNVYTTGRYGNKIDFDPGPGYDTAGSRSPYSSLSCFLVKYDSLGQWVWRRSVYNSQGLAVAVDDSGNVYHCGQINGTATFGSGSSAVSYTSKDSSATIGGDMFVAKWNSQGVLQWARTAGGTSTDQANAVAVDHSGNVYVGGSYNSTGSVDFDRAHPGTMMLPASDYTDGFLIKYDGNGTPQWVRQVAGINGDPITRLAISPVNDNIIICGLVAAACTFPPNTTSYPVHGQSDAFIATYTPAGGFVRAKIIGGTNYDYGTALAVDKSGDIYLGGYTLGAIQFDPLVSGAVTLPGLAVAPFVVKMSDTGAYKWSKSYGGPKGGYIRDLALDDTGNLYVMGTFQDSVNLNPAAGKKASYTSTSFQDMYLLKLSTAGNYIWSVPTYSNRYNDPWSISVDRKANVYAIGAYADSCNFDPGVASAGLNTVYWQTGMFGQNTFAVKYSHLTHTRSTGVSGIPADEHLVIFPNPADNQITIRGLLPNQKYRLAVADMLGRRQLSVEITNEREAGVSLHALPAASYVLSCTNLVTGARQQIILVKTGE